jgi:ABC-type Co2+ transport system permease subunit
MTLFRRERRPLRTRSCNREDVFRVFLANVSTKSVGGNMEIGSDIFLYLFLLVFLGFPFLRILRRTGLSPYFAALVLVPWLGYLVIEAVLAFAPWPCTEPTRRNLEDVG